MYIGRCHVGETPNAKARQGFVHSDKHRFSLELTQNGFGQFIYRFERVRALCRDVFNKDRL